MRYPEIAAVTNGFLVFIKVVLESRVRVEPKVFTTFRLTAVYANQ